jgi:hypothetical protein
MQGVGNDQCFEVALEVAEADDEARRSGVGK